MIKYSINFLVDQKTNINISLKDSLDELNPCYEEDIFIVINSIRIPIASGPIYNNLQALSEKLEKSLKNELPLHESINQDIGYLCNEYYNDDTDFIEKKYNNRFLWIGYDNYIWEFSSKDQGSTTWLYNDREGKIILEITPDYPYFFCDPKETLNYIPYKEWIQLYKPYLTITLPKIVTKKWLMQIEYIIKAIEWYKGL